MLVKNFFKKAQNSRADLLSPQLCATSTISPRLLNDRVRDGNGCDQPGKSTRILGPLASRSARGYLNV